MAGDIVAAAAPNIGREIFYTNEREVRNLRISRYGNGNSNDNALFFYESDQNWMYGGEPAVPVLTPLAMGAAKSHFISNFTDEGGLSVLAQPQARSLAQQNMGMFEEFRRDVQQMAKESPQTFERIFKYIDNKFAENRPLDSNPYERQNQTYYAQADGTNVPNMPETAVQAAQARALTLDDIPDQAKKLYTQTEDRMRAFYAEFGIPFREQELKNAAAVLAATAYEKKLPEVQDFELHNGKMVAFYESRGGAYKEALLDADFANNMPQQQSFARMIETEPKLEEAARQRHLEIAAHEQGMGRSV